MEKERFLAYLSFDKGLILLTRATHSASQLVASIALRFDLFCFHEPVTGRNDCLMGWMTGRKSVSRAACSAPAAAQSG
jgi:hypothetical protein